ncbi:MAG: hypothetical protein QQW96_12335 [Tychonema bourrellyi B0820]|uniref:Uncharacterized protein n=1 Tax=Tychonema bourrellyi FEM_GT703 TaxID=2040638 RepID=A0A2G4F1K8_9CYAN|nr:hypothetical protein [Tychonema bourrellyi]MDQ2098421.1 hypothetical protein [Tychonema bourrellyi B0820]PHX55651.1 hypothetical protein CP500_009575 [Tychonema bourrellyi FEM_GT703]
MTTVRQPLLSCTECDLGYLSCFGRSRRFLTVAIDRNLRLNLIILRVLLHRNLCKVLSFQNLLKFGLRHQMR